jgi:hypothetical protein
VNNNIRRRNARLDKPTAWCCWLSGLLFSLSFNTAVLAEAPAERETVLTRARSELAPLGMSAGGFRLYPSLAWKGLYDDNIFATQTDKESSLISEYSLDMSLRSNWSSHQLNLLAGADIRRHSDFSSENHEDWELSADGRLDISDDSQFYAGGGVRRDHVDRTAPDDASGLTPTQFEQTDVFARFSQQLQRFHVDLDANLKRKDFDDVPGIVNGVNVIINQDDRDRSEYSFGLRASYEIYSERDRVFVALRNDRREYETLQDVILADRSSDGYETLLGVELELSGITSGSLSAGYHIQDYQDPFPDIRAPLYNASLDWSATPLTSVRFDLRRSVVDTTGIYFSGYVTTNTRINVDHELRRNLLLNLTLNYTTDDYAGIATAERSDSTYETIAGTTYMVNRYFHVLIQYQHIERDSSTNIISGTTDSFGFKKNAIFIQLQTQL